jgi:type IV secretion system protein VirD4
MKRWATSVSILMLAVTCWFAGGARVRDGVGAPLRARLREVELAAAYPALWLVRDIAALTPAHRTDAGGQSATNGAVAIPAISAHDWFAEPLPTRWARYTSPAWTRVRLITRVELVVLGAGVLALLLRTVGRGAWFFVMLVVMRRRTRPSASHGSAHWAGAAELRRTRPRRGHADLVVGRVGRHQVSIHERAQYEHLLLVAPTGAGKTSGVILPNLLAEPGTRSLVITDPKRELLRTTSSQLRRRYDARSVWALDFLDPSLSYGYNPLAYVTDAATADLFAQTWVRNTGTSKDAFWENAARTLIAAAALHLVSTEEIVPPLVALVDLLCSMPAEQVSATLAASPVPEVRRLARGFLANMAKNERLLGSVFTELPPRFTCLNIAAVRTTTGVNEINFARLARTPTALYLALDPQYGKTLAPLTACFFLHFFTTLTALAKAAPGGALTVPVMAYLDEFGTIGHIPDFASRMATVRSAGIGCLLVVQDLAQLEKAYGKEDADTILSNATTKLCLARVTRDDAEYFSDLAGKTTVLSANQSASRPLLLPWADRGNRGVGEVERALITPDELRTMRDEIFVIAGDHNPIRARQRRYYDDPALARCVPGNTAADPLQALARATPLPTPTLEACTESALLAEPIDVGGALPLAAKAPSIVPSEPFGIHGSCNRAPARTGTPTIADNLPRLRQAPDMDLPAPDPAIPAGVLPRLTRTEQAVLHALAAEPAANSTLLAARIGVAPATVRKSLSAVRRKLGVVGDDLIEVAKARGLVTQTSPLSTVNAETEVKSIREPL